MLTINVFAFMCLFSFKNILILLQDSETSDTKYPASLTVGGKNFYI